MILLPTFSISLLVARQITVCTTESVFIKTADKFVLCADAEQISLCAQPFFIKSVLVLVTVYKNL